MSWQDELACFFENLEFKRITNQVLRFLHPKKQLWPEACIAILFAEYLSILMDGWWLTIADTLLCVQNKSGGRAGCTVPVWTWLHDFESTWQMWPIWNVFETTNLKHKKHNRLIHFHLDPLRIAIYTLYIYIGQTDHVAELPGTQVRIENHMSLVVKVHRSHPTGSDSGDCLIWVMTNTHTSKS